MAPAVEFPKYICSLVSKIHFEVSKLQHFAHPENLSLTSAKIFETAM